LTVPIIIPNGKRMKIISDGKLYNLRFPIFTLRRFKKIRNKSLVIGFIGPRGAGKSVNMARIALTDYLLRSRIVWSNMEVSSRIMTPVGLKTVTTQPLDKLELRDMNTLYSDGCLVIDEVNMEVAEARRSQSGINLVMNNIVQQLRKRRLDFLWSAQSEMHVDSRLRWQTDIFIKCTDISKTNGLGELTQIDMYDYSGVILGKTPGTQQESLFYNTVVKNKPWWNIYNTWQLQGINANEEEERDFAVPPDVASKIGKLKIIIENSEKERVSKQEVYQLFKATSRYEKQVIGEYLSLSGIILDNQERNFVISSISELISA